MSPPPSALVAAKDMFTYHAVSVRGFEFEFIPKSEQEHVCTRVLCLYDFGFSVFRLSEPGTVSCAQEKSKTENCNPFFFGFGC